MNLYPRSKAVTKSNRLFLCQKLIIGRSSKMTTENFIKAVMEVEETYKDHNDFYELAEKFGFCTPWCGCDQCS